jgi:uncharacterized protein involved in cysteine biosynthesis
MLKPLFLAISDISEPRLRRAVLLSALIALAVSAALWLGLTALIFQTDFFGWWLFDRAVDLLGAVAVAVLCWLLFPAAVSLVMGFFLEGIIAAIEARHYPGLPTVRGQGLAEAAVAGARLALAALALNLLALPLYVFLPGLNLLVYVALNGYLLGREYFELVALRRLEPQSARALRRANGRRVFLAGTLIAVALAVPVVNLFAPPIAAAFMLHLVARLQQS